MENDPNQTTHCHHRSSRFAVVPAKVKSESESEKGADDTG
jgi:hypothetical protein